jgi:hypothetical protein
MAMSQSLTYPLLAMVAARGPEGAVNIAAVAQAFILIFFITEKTGASTNK